RDVDLRQHPGKKFVFRLRMLDQRATRFGLILISNGKGAAMRSKSLAALTATWLVAVAIPGAGARASLTPIGPTDFPATATLITFDGLADGTEVNGLSVSGVNFQVLLGGSPTNGVVDIDGGPGFTNNISPPNVVSLGNAPDLILEVDLPTPSTQFGFG